MLCLFFNFYLLIVAVFSAPYQHGLSEDALKFLQKLPEKKISLEFVISRSLHSDQYLALQSALHAVDVPVYAADASLDWILFSAVSRSQDKNEARSSFSPNKNFNTIYSVGAKSTFNTGTSLNTQIAHTKTELGFNNIPENKFSESTISLSITQNLWKNSFGYGTKANKNSALEQSKYLGYQFNETEEEWLKNSINIYYRAWNNKAQVSAEIENLKRRKRLVKITKIKLKRGTAEYPDVLQVESAKNSAQVSLSASSQELAVIWRELVSALKFPYHWTTINPVAIPLLLDEPVGDAKEICTNYESNNTPLTNTYKKRQAQYIAKQWNTVKAIDTYRPQLDLNLSMKANAIDTQASKTWKESAKLENPNYVAELKFSMPLGKNAAKSQYHRAIADELKEEALLAKAKDDLKINWINVCSNLVRLEEKRYLLKQAYTKQLERTILEERRFQVGRSSVLSVIQSGDDATRAELEYKNSEVEIRTVAWQIQQMAGRTKEYLKKVGEQFGAFNLKGIQ